MIHEIRRLTSLRLLLLAAVFGLGAKSARADDPVEDLREHLRRSIPIDRPNDELPPEALEYRKTKIQEAADRMKTIGQMRRALVLDEWKVGASGTVNVKVRDLDEDMRRMIGERMKKALGKMARQDNSNARLAVANIISEMGPTMRAIDPADTGGFSRSLEPLVAQLCRDPDLGVRQEAIRAMGNINGPPKDVADVFRSVLQKDKDVGPRRLAADGLQQMMKVSAHLFSRQGEQRTGVAANRNDVLGVLQAIAPVAAVGVKDADSEVRMLSLQAVQAAAQALAEILEAPATGKDTTEVFGRKNFPPPGRQLTPMEAARIVDAYKRAEEDLAQVKPMLDALRNEVLTYTRGLRDPEPRVRLAACQAFESLANARLRLVRRANGLPTIRNAKEGIDRAPADLLKQADFLQPVLDKEMPQAMALLRDPDVRIRRSAATALEALEDKAAPAMQGLIVALQDPDRFVRWTASKALGYLPHDNAGPAIMPLATLLSDPELPVRIQAASSLEALGPIAKGAVLALAQSLKSGDIDARLAAMYALSKIGPSHLQPALPALIDCLGDRDPRVVKAACEVIDEIGPAAAAALPALRRLIGHDDAGVRQGASDAIASILRVPE